MKSVLALSLLALGFGVSDNEGEEPQEPNVLERYDLRPVLPRIDQGNGWEALLTQLPPRWWTDVSEIEIQSMHEDAAPDVILDLVTQVLGDALNVKGSQVSLESDSHLLVLAPAGVQAMVAEVLGLLESVLIASVELRVDVITTPDALGEEILARNVLPAAEADRLVESLVARGGTHRQSTFQLSAGRTSAVDQSTTIPMVFDYDVEIAQGSFIWDPIVLDVMDGLRLYLRGVPRPDGTVISAVVLQGDLQGEVRDRQLDLRGGVSREQTGGTAFIGGPQAIQTAEILTRSVAFTSFVPDGQALVAASQTKLGDGTTGQVIVIRQPGNSTPPFVSSQISGTTRTLALLNTELFRTPEFSVNAKPHLAEQEGHPVVAAALSAEYSSFLYDWLRYRYSVWRQIGPWAVVVTDPSWDSRGAEALEELVLRSKARPSVVGIQLDLVTSEDGDDPPVSWSLPVLAGTTCGFVVGVSSTFVSDYDVEVAQYSSVPDPVVRSSFNGLAAAVEVSRGGVMAGGGSSWVLDVSGTGQLLRGPMATFEQEGPVNGRIDRPEFDVLNVNERLTLPQEDGGVSRSRVGPQARRTARAGLSLMVTVRG